MKTNIKTPLIQKNTYLQDLERTVSTCLLWENSFYQSGQSIAQNIADLCLKVSPVQISELAVKTRNDLKLRHVPLFLAVQLAKRADLSVADRQLIAMTLPQVIQRPDEMGEFLSLYMGDRRQPLSAQVKKGLALTYPKFSAYQLAKWNREAKYTLKDIMFLTHPKPKDAVQAEVWKKLVAGTLESPETWEVRLSRGEDPKHVWSSMLTKKANGFRDLGYMALLMNLRNINAAGVDQSLVESAILDGAPLSKALPLRFVNAAEHAPMYKDVLSAALQSVALGTLEGGTAVVIDVSGSMNGRVSEKSSLSRWQAAAVLGILIQTVCKDSALFSFSNRVEYISKARGLDVIEAVNHSQPHGGTRLRDALRRVKLSTRGLSRVVVITDEQSQDGIEPPWVQHSYLINVASYTQKLDTDQGWKRLSGWSERVIDWIMLEEGGAFGVSDEDSE